MKEYVKPKINEIECSIEDIIAKSYGNDQAGDKLVDLFGGN